MSIVIPKETIEIIHKYEGLGGKRNGRYYPYQGKADKEGVLTIGRGHVLSKQEKLNRVFENGLTIEEVDDLFIKDIQPRARRLVKLIPDHTACEFAGALSFFYNNEYSWGPKGSPGNFHRAGLKLQSAQSFLLYIKSGRPLKPRLGLWRRRATEALCYLTGKVVVSDNNKGDDLLTELLRQEDVHTSKP